MDCIVHGVEKSNFHFHFSLAVKNPPPVQVHAKEKGPILGLGRSPEGGHGDRSPLFLPGESHGHRSLVGYNP